MIAIATLIEMATFWGMVTALHLQEHLLLVLLRYVILLEHLLQHLLLLVSVSVLHAPLHLLKLVVPLSDATGLLNCACFSNYCFIFFYWLGLLHYICWSTCYFSICYLIFCCWLGFLHCRYLSIFYFICCFL